MEEKTQASQTGSTSSHRKVRVGLCPQCRTPISAHSEAEIAACKKVFEGRIDNGDLLVNDTQSSFCSVCASPRSVHSARERQECAAIETCDHVFQVVQHPSEIGETGDTILCMHCSQRKANHTPEQLRFVNGSMSQPEPPPVRANGPKIWDLVIEDMRERDRIGTTKYGTPLQAFNGRRALTDAYQEGLDQLVYMRQEIEERKAIEFQLAHYKEVANRLKEKDEVRELLAAESNKQREELEAELATARRIVWDIDSILGNRQVFDRFNTRQEKIAYAIQCASKADKMMHEMNQVEQALGGALGYPELYEGVTPEGEKITCGPDYPNAKPTGTICIGEHVTVTIAREAATKIKDLLKEKSSPFKPNPFKIDPEILKPVKGWIDEHGGIVGVGNVDGFETLRVHVKDGDQVLHYRRKAHEWLPPCTIKEYEEREKFAKETASFGWIEDPRVTPGRTYGISPEHLDTAFGHEIVPEPTIVVLCGSTRFYKEFQRANYEETMKGNIVLSIGFAMHASEETHGEKLGCTPEQKIALDELHKRKIDLADEVYVLNVGGYVGESTASEIQYAKDHGKPIRYLEDIPF